MHSSRRPRTVGDGLWSNLPIGGPHHPRRTDRFGSGVVRALTLGPTDDHDQVRRVDVIGRFCRRSRPGSQAPVGRSGRTPPRLDARVGGLAGAGWPPRRGHQREHEGPPRGGRGGRRPHHGTQHVRRRSGTVAHSGVERMVGRRPAVPPPGFVLTHHRREPLVCKGGTTFHFVTGGIAAARRLAEAAAKGKDVCISGRRRGREAGTSERGWSTKSKSTSFPSSSGRVSGCLTARCCPRSRSDKSGRWKPPEWPTSRIEYGGLPSGKPRGSSPPPRASRTTRVGPRRAVPSAGDVRAGGVAIGARHLRELRAGGKREGGLCETGNPPRSRREPGARLPGLAGFPARRAVYRESASRNAPIS